MAGKPRGDATELRVARALTLMREGFSATEAAHRAGTTLRTMHRYASTSLRKDATGRYRATRSDRLGRPMRFLTEHGLDTVLVRSARSASRIARHWAAVHHYLRTGMTDRLKEFAGRSIRSGGRPLPFITDPDLIERLESVGQVRFEDIYETPN